MTCQDMPASHFSIHLITECSCPSPLSTQIPVRISCNIFYLYLLCVWVCACVWVCVYVCKYVCMYVCRPLQFGTCSSSKAARKSCQDHDVGVLCFFKPSFDNLTPRSTSTAFCFLTLYQHCAIYVRMVLPSTVQEYYWPIAGVLFLLMAQMAFEYASTYLWNTHRFTVIRSRKGVSITRGTVCTPVIPCENIGGLRNGCARCNRATHRCPRVKLHGYRCGAK